MNDLKESGESVIDENSAFTLVVDGKGNRKIVRKSSVCWLLSKDKHKLSSDRLVRVAEREYSLNDPDTNSSTSQFLNKYSLLISQSCS